MPARTAPALVDHFSEVKAKFCASEEFFAPKNTKLFPETRELFERVRGKMGKFTRRHTIRIVRYCAHAHRNRFFLVENIYTTTNFFRSCALTLPALPVACGSKWTKIFARGSVAALSISSFLPPDDGYAFYYIHNGFFP